VQQNLDHLPLGSQFQYGDKTYGINSDDVARIDVPLLSYILARAQGRIQLDVLIKGATGRTEQVSFDGLGLSPITIPGHVATDQQGSASSTFPWAEGATPAKVEHYSFLVGTAEGAVLSGGRLYLQAVSVPPKVTVDAVSAALALGGGSRPLPLLALSSDLASQTQSQLSVKGGSSVIQDYQLFFELSQPTIQPGATINLQASLGYFEPSYKETFNIPGDLQLGKPVAVSGNGGGTIVIQLAYPFDVILFERQQTPPNTQKLIPKIAAAGFAPRRNTTTASLRGDYNVIYSGEDVSISALQAVMRVVVDAGVKLKAIQAQRQLKNGLQNQIQIGGNDLIACLDPIDNSKLTHLLHTTSNAEFLSMLEGLPRPPESCDR
jgi:hypothetical protein